MCCLVLLARRTFITYYAIGLIAKRISIRYTRVQSPGAYLRIKMMQRMYKLALILALLSIVSTYRLVPRNNGIEVPCSRCDIDKLHPFTIKTLAPVCGPCGDLYGTGMEYCCMCHKVFFDKCINAAGK
ncbi:uncharacterized protein LOC127842708 [Dreissena polymorpha]|uniref:Uncharacterized protein n=1 Tax=Dreissena polymorpha TaxID=45954 RepID=A0A9D4N4C1_DREPO|nr:uncharacterized protein LOC127842708 [Dreissena polymorpha]KAH3886497.1 hypothetical protein DPMN_010507 [Dreissena polymorpha]